MLGTPLDRLAGGITRDRGGLIEGDHFLGGLARARLLCAGPLRLGKCLQSQLPHKWLLSGYIKGIVVPRTWASRLQHKRTLKIRDFVQHLWREGLWRRGGGGWRGS